VVKFLCTFGADVDKGEESEIKKRSENNSPLFQACSLKNKKAALILYSYGAEIIHKLNDKNVDITKEESYLKSIIQKNPVRKVFESRKNISKISSYILPFEVWILILKQLTFHDIHSVMLVCKGLWQASNSDVIWNELYKQTYFVDLERNSFLFSRSFFYMKQRFKKRHRKDRKEQIEYLEEMRREESRHVHQKTPKYDAPFVWDLYEHW